MRLILAFAAGVLVGGACACACACLKRCKTARDAPRSYPPDTGAADNRRATGHEWGPETPPETPGGGPAMTGEPHATGLSPHEPPIKRASAADAPPKP